MNTQVIKEIGTINIEEVEVCDGQLEIHVPVNVISSQMEKILDFCMNHFKQKYPDVENPNFDVRLMFSFGYDNPEFELMIYIFEDADSGNNVEFFDGFKVEISEDTARQIKRIAWNKLGDAILGL